MEVIRLKSMCDKLNLSIIFGEEDDKLFFSDSVVLSFSTALNAFNSRVKRDLKGLCVLISQADAAFLSALSDEQIKECLSAVCSCELIAVHEDSAVIEEVSAAASEHGVRVCAYNKSDNETAYDLSTFIEGKLNSVQIVHGVLLDIFGVGVMLTGDSGTGKSETALELIGRGHLLVADDAVALRREGNSLIGCSPALTRHLMDIRGIGIIDIRAMFGAGAIKIEQELDVVINLEPFDEFKDYREKDVFLLNGVSVPMITLPLRTGRNMAVLTEVAARNLRLNAMGQNAEEELSRRIKNR